MRYSCKSIGPDRDKGAETGMTLLNTKQSTILVVDDSRPQGYFIKKVLEQDYETLVAFDGMEALELYKQEKPDLILLDIEMPEMDGFEVCRRVKAMSGDTFLPIIFLTSKSDVNSLIKGLQIGAEDYLTKPFAPEELIARIRAALRTKKLYNQLEAANAIIEQERDVIANIQRGLLCDSPPKIPGLKFFMDYQPSSKAGGDYYDFIPIDNDHLGILVSDVSGHGTPAAVIMAMMRVLFRSFLSENHSPRTTLQQLNKILRQNLETGYFITTFYGVIHLPTRKMKFASAGHNPPILVEYDSGSVRELWLDKGIPLMILPNNEMAEGEIQLIPNSKLVLYTDGLTEAKNAEGENFGAKRLANTLLELGKNLPAGNLGQKVKDVIHRFMGDNKFTDDYTLVILEVEALHKPVPLSAPARV